MGIHSKLNALVFAGDGLNCEIETQNALVSAGFKSKIEHINDLLKSKSNPLEGISLIVIPGGFSFGDELGSGKILSIKIKHGFGNKLNNYLNNKGALFGICNGFQVMTQLGVFKNEFGTEVALAHNQQGHFLDRWVRLQIIGKSIFTDKLLKNGYREIELPIRHGEGRLQFLNETKATQAMESGACVLRYEEDVNGSWNKVAAITAYQGRVFGMMPHPEAFWCNELHPEKNIKNLPLGTMFFESAYEKLLEDSK